MANDILGMVVLEEYQWMSWDIDAISISGRFPWRMLYMTVISERKCADVNCSIERVYVGAW